MDVPTNEWIFWLITGIVTLLITILLILFKRNLFIQTKQQETTQKLTTNVTVLTEKLVNFQIGCTKIETNQTTRLNKHSEDIDRMALLVGKHEVKLDDHDRRIGELEHK